jgi:hypothetical protein
LAHSGPSIHVTPASTDLTTAQRWFDEFEGAGLDGIVAKSLTITYQPDKRVMFKIKHERTADCVVAGYRAHKTDQNAIGSLLLGLYKDDGSLASVGVIGAFPMAERRRLFTELQSLVTTFEEHPWNWAAHMAGDRTPRRNEGSRWNAGKDLSFMPLRPERVVEVRYDHMAGERFRHTAQVNRWRPDRDPHSCTYEKLEKPVTFSLSDIVPASALLPHLDDDARRALRRNPKRPWSIQREDPLHNWADDALIDEGGDSSTGCRSLSEQGENATVSLGLSPLPKLNACMMASRTKAPDFVGEGRVGWSGYDQLSPGLAPRSALSSVFGMTVQNDVVTTSTVSKSSSCVDQDIRTRPTIEAGGASVVATVAPRCFASWMAKVPTLPVPAWMKTFCPGQLGSFRRAPAKRSADQRNGSRFCHGKFSRRLPRRLIHGDEPAKCRSVLVRPR